jgi:hypothetical protein
VRYEGWGFEDDWKDTLARFVMDMAPLPLVVVYVRYLIGSCQGKVGVWTGAGEYSAEDEVRGDDRGQRCRGSGD